jgi:hypothetical protein
MAHVRKGQFTATREWRKHLRFWKRFFGKAERREARRQAREEAKARPPRRVFDFTTQGMQTYGGLRFANPPYGLRMRADRGCCASRLSPPYAC